MRDLLQTHHGRYVRALILGFSQLSSAYLEPLSPQKERVLSLLAAGRSNPEIANELVVSVNTIKTQVKGIYRKLNITNRAETRDVALHLNLL
jgi:LuxR family maltose regulon positive regulatory protein